MKSNGLRICARDFNPSQKPRIRWMIFERNFDLMILLLNIMNRITIIIAASINPHDTRRFVKE